MISIKEGIIKISYDRRDYESVDEYAQVLLIDFWFNPFPPSVPIWERLAKLSILILEGTIKKISYERRDYESVDEKSLS